MALALGVFWHGSPLVRPPAVRSAAVAAPHAFQGGGVGVEPVSSQAGLSEKITILQFCHFGRFQRPESWEADSRAVSGLVRSVLVALVSIAERSVFGKLFWPTSAV